MVNAEFIIEYSELDMNKIDFNEKHVYINKDGSVRKYIVINDEKELVEYTLKHKDYRKYSENKENILVTCECNNILGFFNDAIFLKKFKIDSYLELNMDGLLYLAFNRCDFFQDIELAGGDYKRIKINESYFNKNFIARFVNCEKLRIDNMTIEKNMVIENSEIGKFIVNTSKFQGNLASKEVNILNDFILDKVKGCQNLHFDDCRFEGLSKLELDVAGELRFSQCSFYKKSEINFDDISGKFSLYKTNFSDKCYLEYELLENKKYEPLIFRNDYKKTKWNFLIVSDIYKSSGRTEQYLETFYYFKKYQRLERKNKGTYRFSLLEYLIELTTKYYTSWKRALLSMAFIILAFFFLYSSFPNLLISKDVQLSSKSLFVTVFEMFKSSNFDFKFVLSKFGNTLYFTIITFTTVGYGDITPLNWMKIAVSIESFFGIIFTSSFVVSLSRRFL